MFMIDGREEEKNEHFIEERNKSIVFNRSTQPNRVDIYLTHIHNASTFISI